MDSYDLIVIGTGTAAQVTAARLRRAGRSVAMIDHRPFAEPARCSHAEAAARVLDCLDGRAGLHLADFRELLHEPAKPPP